MGYRVVLEFDDGSEEEDDEVCATEEEAEAYALVLIGNYNTGGEVLHMSNPGDYPRKDEEVNYRIVEVND